MILEFSFSNYGPVKESVTLSFEATTDDTLENYYVVTKEDGNRILKTAVIYGPNASGKSTILEALDFCRNLVVNPVEQKNQSIRYKRHLLGTTKNETSRFELIFYIGEVKYNYQLKLDNSKIHEEDLFYYPNNRPARIYSRVTKDEISELKFGTKISLSKKEKYILEGNTLKNNTVLGSYSKSNITNELLERVYAWFNDILKPIINPDTSLFGWTSESISNNKIDKGKLINWLQKADLDIADFEIIEEELEMDSKVESVIELMPFDEETKKNIKNQEKLTAKDIIFKHEFEGDDGEIRSMDLEREWESNGTLKFYELSGPLLLALKNDYFMNIDELDSSLHPDLLKHLFITFLDNSNEAQLLFTTHNVSFLEEKDLLRKDVVWLTEKDKEGAANLYSVSDFRSSEIRDFKSVYNKYRIGKLGAKPNTTKIFFDYGQKR